MKMQVILIGDEQMKTIAAEIDKLFGFTSTWTWTRGESCWENNGTINIDEDEIDKIMSNAGIEEAKRNLVVVFLMGHEKGHHLQEEFLPGRKYEIEHHAMEIEADLIGAWVLARLKGKDFDKLTSKITKHFDDAIIIAQRLGVALGDFNANAPHHPWAEQRELAFVRGPEIALQYPQSLTNATWQDFAEDMRKTARTSGM